MTRVLFVVKLLMEKGESAKRMMLVFSGDIRISEI